MTDRKKRKKSRDRPDKENRLTRGRSHSGASFPVSPLSVEMPPGYGVLFENLKRRITEERLRITMAANSAMTLLYWDIGRAILERQEKKGGVPR